MPSLSSSLFGDQSSSSRMLKLRSLTLQQVKKNEPLTKHVPYDKNLYRHTMMSVRNGGAVIPHNVKTPHPQVPLFSHKKQGCTIPASPNKDTTTCGKHLSSIR